jgi:dimethylhistidine N-methyltransferase
VSPRFARRAVRPETNDIRVDALSGLRARPMTLPPKLFYDDRGAWLFERICELPEYYLTRAELEILRAHAADIAALAGPRCALIEYGSGAGTKIRLLLDALDRPSSYVPVDVSLQQLTRVAASIAADYPDVVVRPVCADYTRAFVVPSVSPRVRRMAFFPGSTIGNLHPPEATAFLQRIRQLLGRDGILVLGVDRKKSADVLNAAYNDAEGVTAEFNLNMLRRLNREADATFDLSRFRHRAFWNADAGRIEMHIESLAGQVVRVAGVPVRFEVGDTIWTESSYKYDRASLDALVTAAGFRIVRLDTDSNEHFWVACLAVTAPVV